MQTSVQDGAVASESLAKHVRHILVLCEKADALLDEDDPQALVQPGVHPLRARILKLCKRVFSDVEWSCRILERVWKSCYYSVICRIRRAALSVEQKSWTELLIAKFVRELCGFASEYPHLCAAACIYVGDLRRYAWLISGHEKYKTLALLCYRKSAKLDEENGTAMNQQGLLLQDVYPPRALLYFLLANNAPVPFHGAYSNVLSLLKQQNEQHKQQEGDITLRIVEHCFINFRHLDFHELSVKWSDYVVSQLEIRHATRVALSINIIILAAIALVEKGKEMEMRNLSQVFFRISENVIRGLEEWCVSDVGTTNLRRRRASSSSSREEVAVNGKGHGTISSSSSGEDVVSEEGEPSMTTEESVLSKRNLETQHRIQALIVALLHGAVSLAPYLYNDHVPSAYYYQYEEYCQRLIQFLNLLELRLNGGNEGLWQLGGTTPWMLLPRFLRKFVNSSCTPVLFDDFFRFEPRNSTKENVMKNMAKLRLAHDAEEEQVRASLPVYVVPEEDVLLKRLNIIKTILQNGDLIVVVAEGTLRSMDHMKKDKLMAREALRWIDAHISRESGRLRIRSAQTPLECAEELAAQSPPTSSTVIVTVLTMGHVDDISTIKTIMVENAESFCARYDGARRDFISH